MRYRRITYANDNTTRLTTSPYSRIAAYVVLWLLVVLISFLWAYN